MIRGTLELLADRIATVAWLSQWRQSFVSPGRGPQHSGKVDGVEFLPGNANAGSGAELVGGEPFALKPLIVEKKPIAN